MVKPGHLQRPLNLVATVSAQLRREVRDKHAVGEKLATEAALAERFGVSRTVLREAVAALRTEGMLESRQGSGIYVVRTDQEPVFRLTRAAERERHLRSVYELRFGLEVASAGLAALHRGEADLRALGKALAAMERSETRPAADLRFHATIAAATGNEHYQGLVALLAKELSGLIREANSGATDYRTPEGPVLLAEHQRIHDAIAASDAEAARTAMARHLQNSAQRFSIEIRGMGLSGQAASAVAYPPCS
ncbi:FadR/GntR family transcriptional regulator [Roseomonas mucosa]|uniref:FadR/GntR family transcriptional regulator n=1 Tax=Roseomonas mucosa TaxID=207340 RepID=UPI00325411D7